MKLLLQNSEEFQVQSLDDLLKVIPKDSVGKPVNYGQGEGQVEIDNTVWGFYVNGRGEYFMQFEEGQLDWCSLNSLVESIVARINESFDLSVRIKVEGPFTNRDDA